MLLEQKWLVHWSCCLENVTKGLSMKRTSTVLLLCIYAAFANSIDAAKLLLDKKCKKCKKDCEGRTAAELAKMLGYGDIVQLLSNVIGLGLRKSDIYNCKHYNKIVSPKSMGCYEEFTDELLKQEYQETFLKEENELVKGEVRALMERFSEQFAHSVHVSIDWPVPLDFSKCQLYGLFRDGYDDLDLTSTDYEEVLLKSLPSAAIDAYVLGKTSNIC
ncbi:hypothetical protein CAPTEDRAFT_190435 [Capitella teleta]|uniref:Uncharacterized protein n=1 Tax=Capitella teleta TaxID=283909 RepID=R7VCZ3_CAPTE|nr:hypothetical protein CAPTEDRAFT_190435 [Capitella teleta]|eukprot:ELU16447.1 hypothetical protein CAPTEDRAFT_190435 [Capitella teleta]